MKIKYAIELFLIFLIFCGFNIPDKPVGYVNDYAGILKSGEVEELNLVLSKFDSQTSTQIFVAVFNSLDGENLEYASIKIAEKWKPGDKNNNNGVLLAVFLQDRKIRIETGYGLESKFTDAIASQIIRNYIAPEFKKNNYYLGIKNGIESIIQVTKGEFKNTGRKNYKPSVFDMIVLVFGILVFLIIIIKNPGLFAAAAAMSYGSSGRNRTSGGSGFGSFGGGGFSGGGGGSFGGGGASGGW
ncbi:TPM domain-containing protein [Candidatus Dependentiae bacterium]|nr:TPM domain-containing protein [Candidatus Dependentiae bacterium]